LNGSASVDLLDLLKLIVPEDNNLHSLTLSEIKETLGNCVTNDIYTRLKKIKRYVIIRVMMTYLSKTFGSF